MPKQDLVTADEAGTDIEKLRRFVAHVISAGDLERARVAHALHESTAQNLSALVMQLGALASDPTVAGRKVALAAARDLARATLEEVRLMSHTMYPRSLDELGLVEALRQFARSSTEDGVPVRVDAPSWHGRPLTQTIRSVLYWVAQEAVTNAARYGAAKSIILRLHRDGQRVVLEIEDDGVGFNIDEAEARRPGMGIFSMRERVALVDGDLHIDSGTHGTRVTATVPLATTE